MRQLLTSLGLDYLLGHNSIGSVMLHFHSICKKAVNRNLEYIRKLKIYRESRPSFSRFDLGDVFLISINKFGKLFLSHTSL